MPQSRRAHVFTTLDDGVATVLPSGPGSLRVDFLSPSSTINETAGPLLAILMNPEIDPVVGSIFHIGVDAGGTTLYDPQMSPVPYTAAAATVKVCAVDDPYVVRIRGANALAGGQVTVRIETYELRRFREVLAANLGLSIFINLMFASVIAFGVVYNAARISLSERSRELASLRVLGFTRGEVSRVLFTELVLLTVLAIPPGWMMGYGFGWLLIKAFSSDLYRVPFVIETATYAKATLVVLAATVTSTLIVRKRIDRLDLIAVLKTRD